MEAVVIDVSPDYFVSAEDDLRTEADVEDVSIMDDVTHVLSSPERDSRSSLKRLARYNGEEDEKTPSRPPRKKSMSISSSKSEKSQRIESESFHSAQKDEEPPLSPLPSSKQDDSDTFADALSSAHLSITESLVQKKDILEECTTIDNKKRSLSESRSTGSSLDDGIGGNSSFDLVTGVPKRKKQRRKKQHKDKSSSEEYSGHSDYDRKRRRSKSEDEVDAIISDQPVNGTEPDVRYETEPKKLFIEEELPDNLKGAKEAVNISGGKESEETTKDILLESRVALRKALKACEKVPETLVRQFSSIHERISDVCQIVEVTQEKDIENLNKLEKPLHTLLKSLSKITSAEEIEIIRNILEPSIVQLSDVVKNFGPSLQSTLTVLNIVNERICNIPSETEKGNLIKSTSVTSGNISGEIVDPLIDIQSAFSAIIDYMERSKLNNTPQEALKMSPLAACLTELRECASHTAHTAMTFRENETLNSLMEFREPLLDLQSILAMDYISQELPIIKETTLAIKKLKCVVVNILKNSGNREALSRAETILTILEDTDKQVLQLVELLEIETTQKQVLKSLNIDQSLSNVHFALSSVLEKQEEHKVSSNLITCIETLRQAIGSSAVTIASLKNPVDEEITQEISRLKESLLNLQKDLLTEKHKPGEEEILNNLMSPISRLKDIIHGVIKQSSSAESMISILQLLEEIERDATLVAKEISKKKVQKESDTKSRMEDTEEKSSSNLAGQINRSLHPLKHWLSTTSEDSTKDELSELSSTIEELKRDVTQIVIQTSYSEPPSDESLIEALIELREPLIRLKNAISIYHGPEDLSTLENLDRPMKHLLQTIMDVLQEYTNEESLLSIVDIVQQIENQLPLSIKNALYQQELKQSTKTSNVETEEEDEAVTASRETIPGTLTEIASTPLFESTVLPIEQATEQVTMEDDSKKAAEITPMIIKSEMQEREKKANKLITILSVTLEKLQLEMTGILEDFEESTTRTTMIPQSKLANSLEELRRTISTIRMMTTVYNEEIGSSEEKVYQATLVLTNLTQPLINIRELLSKSHKHDVLELMILNRLIPLLNMIENNVIKPTTQFINKDEDTEKEFEFLLYVLEEIKTEVPIVIQKISSRQKILECLWDISKPLENIMERMKDLEQTAEETLETDVAKILGNPTATLLKDIKTAIQETDVLDQRESIIVELQKLLEPLQEFHSCLSMVQSSRKSLVPEACLLEERRSVILRAIDGLQKQVCHTVEAIANMKEAFLFNESLMQLNSAILKMQKQIGKTDYSRRSSSVKIPLQHRLTGTLDRLANAILVLEKHADKDTREVVSKCLEALQKQISFTQMQFIEIGSELVDEEAIVEGFLYPTSQVLSALNVLKENMQKAPSAISHSVIVQLQELADSISELSSSLLMHKAELVQEGASNEAPIVETFSAVIDVLDEVKDSIVAIEKMTEQKANVIITEIESVTDEIIEISQEEIETIMVITETSTEAVVQESAESKIEDAPQMTQTSVFETSEVVTCPEQEVNLVDTAKHEETQEEKEKQKYLISQTSKFNSAINNLTQPLQGLSNFIKSAMQESLISKSDEDKRKIQELTALMQIIYDLQATNTSIKTCIRSLSSSLSSSSPLINNDFSCMENIFDDLEQAVAVIISLTDEGVKSELKENIMTSLQSFAKPLNDLENVLESICQTINENKYFDENGELLVTTARVLIPYISDTIKCLKMIQIPKYVQIIDEKETEISKIKEEVKNIEETTARPLEELIEAIMESQEQVKCDKILESSSPFADLIKLKDNDDLQLVEMEAKVSEVNKVSKMDDVIKEMSNLSTQDAATPQEILTPSPTPDQIEEHVLKKGEINLIEECIEKEESLEISGKEKIEIIKSPEKATMQKEQITIETLQMILSPLQILHKSLDEVEKMGVLQFSDEKTVAFSTLLEPLINLEHPSFENSTEMNQSAVTLQKLSVAYVLEELQKSIATVQEQVQLYTAVEACPNEITKMRLMQAVEKLLEDLKLSLANIKSDPTICQQAEELLGTEQITVFQTLAKSMEEFGEKCMSIIDQVKLEEVPPLQIAKQEEQTLNPEVLQKIVDPIHILHETLSQINDLHKAELLEIRQEKEEFVELNVVIDPLKRLEKLLITDVQHVAVAQEEVSKDFEKHQVLLANADLKPVLEELKTSISVVQQQEVSSENNSATETLNKALESLKMPLTVVEETLDHSNEVTETEKVSTLLSFAKSVTETANQLVTIAKQDVAQQENQVTSLLKTITIPIEGLQSAILELEDRVSQTMETKESKKVVALECMVQPLQELQQSFLAASHQEIALSLQRLPIKPILDNLNKFVAEVQEQVAIVQDNLTAKTTSDDVIVLKDFARSLSNLRTSTVVLQQLNAIENASQQIVEIENASALQAFAKSIEEFRKCCSIVVERSKVVEAFTSVTELKQPTKDTQLLENIIVPLRILQEQILTIEETKMQESEILEFEIKKPVNVLSSLVEPLQQLEKSFVATVRKEQVIEHDGYSLTSDLSSTDLKKLALQPILEEVQKSIATVQEQVVFETGSHITSETDVLLKSIAQPLVDLKASIASIQQVITVAPDLLNELAQQNVSALETFAETLHNLSECIAMCNHQQIIIEPAADTISEGASSLNTWADIVEESFSRVTCPMVIDQGAIESPAEIAMSISEDEASALKTLAKPLTELRKCLAVIVDERKIVAPSDTTRSLPEKEDISLLQTMIQPLLELNDAATAVIQEQIAIERAKEHSFEIEGNNEYVLQPLIEPLEELRHSIAIIQDQMLIETSTDRQGDNVVLDALAEPLFDLQRAISVLEARVMSPDVQSIPEDTSNSWITECLAIPLHEIERSLADIRQCTIMEPKTIMMEAQARTITPDWSIVEKLEKPVEGIKSVVSRMEDNFTKTKVLKPMAEALIKVQEELTSLKNTYAVNTVNEEQCFNAIIEPLSNLERCILSVKKEIDKSKSRLKLKDITILSSALTIPLTELECCIVTAKESPNANLKNLERPLELFQNALETVLSAQQSKKFSDLSTKVVDTISDIQKSIESIEHKLEQQEVSVLEVCIECEALGMLAKPLQNIKQSIPQIQENPSTANLMIDALRNLEKSVAIIREQSADKPLAEPQHLHFDIAGNLLKCLIPCLNELQESIQASKLLWCEETALEGLTILDEPIYKLKTAINIICDQILREEIFWIDISKAALQKKVKKKDREESDEIESVKKEKKTTKVEIEDTKSVNKDLSTTTSGEENKKNLDEKESEKIIKKQVEKVTQEKSEQKDIEKEKIELKKQEKVENVETIENLKKQKDIKDKKDKKTSELYKEKDETEESKKEDNQKKEKVLDKTEQKEQKHIQLEIDKTEIQNKKEKPDKTKNKEVKQEEEEQKKIKEIKKQEEEEEKAKLKEETDENLKSEKIENLEKEQDKSSKKELTQEKIREEKQIEIQEKEKEQKKQEVEEKEKEVKEIKTKSEINQLEKKQDELIKKKGFIQEKIKEEKQKQIEVQEKEQKKQEVEEKLKEVKEIKSKSEINELEKKQEELIKIENSIQEKIIQEEQKQKEQENKVKIEEKEQKKNKATENIKEYIKEKEVETIKEKETKQKEKKEMEKVEEKDKTKSEKIAKIEKKKVKKDETQQEEKKIKNKVEESSTTVKDEKTKKTIEDLEQKKESKTKEEPTQEKIIEKKQTDQEQIREKRKEQKEEEILEKSKEEKEKQLKEEKIKELEKKIQESNKTKTSAEKIKEKKKDEVKISKKEAEEQKQITQETEEIKAKDKEPKSKKDVQEKKKTFKKNEQEDATVETVKEKSIKEKKEEIVKTKETMQLIQIEKPKDNINFQRQQEEKRLRFEEIERSKRKVEDRQWRLQDNENWLRAKEDERADKSNKYKMQKEKPARTEYDNQRLYKMEIEHLEKRRAVGRSKEDVNYIFDKDEEKYLKRNEETRIRRDETARFLREEEQKLRRRHEEEIYRSKQRREEQIKESEWSRRRENETDRFLKNMLENRYKSDKSTALFFDDYHRDYISRLESSMPTLTSSFRSYSWRDSLTSLNKNLDEYKLRGSPIDKYYYDTGSSYRRRRKREHRMIRARSISLMKYEDYLTEDSDATIIPNTHTRSRRKDAVRRINFNAYELTPPCYIDFGKKEVVI